MSDETTNVVATDDVVPTEPAVEVPNEEAATPAETAE